VGQFEASQCTLAKLHQPRSILGELSDGLRVIVTGACGSLVPPTGAMLVHELEPAGEAYLFGRDIHFEVDKLGFLCLSGHGQYGSRNGRDLCD
jgi:hypothetical protein